MASSFGGFNTALTSLYAHRRGVDVTGQNIANANTEGYTRQRVDLEGQAGAAGAAMYAKPTGLGNGVEVKDVQRLRNEYLESRGRAEHAQNSYLNHQAGVHIAIEGVFAEPGDTALQAQLQDMWGAWSDVANNPKDSAARTALLQQSATVTDTLHSSYGTLAGQWSSTRTQLAANANEVNTIATAVAQLNKQISEATAAGVVVNELKDQRDVHATQLADLVGAASYRRDNGAMDIFLGGSPLVSDTNVFKIEVVGATDLSGQRFDPPAAKLQVRSVDFGTPVATGGTMGSMADTLTEVIPGFAQSLDDVVARLAAKVNTAHAAGYGLTDDTSRPFFTGTTAATIAVAITDPHHVAASATTTVDPVTLVAKGSLDGSMADQLADLGVAGDGPDAVYRDMIVQLGVASQTMGRRSDIQRNVTEQVDAARESEAGVNLDEEMTNMIKFQRGYEAASRVLTTLDEMLDQLINRTGLVGR